MASEVAPAMNEHVESDCGNSIFSLQPRARYNQTELSFRPIVCHKNKRTYILAALNNNKCLDDVEILTTNHLLFYSGDNPL